MKKILFFSFLFLFSQNLYSEVQISGLSNAVFGIWSGQGRIRNDQLLCIYTNPVSNYYILAVGDAANNKFILGNGIDKIRYRVFFNDKPRPNGRVRLYKNQLSPIFYNNNSCNSGENAFLRIQISERQLQKAHSGYYRGNLSLTLIPD